MTTIDLRQETLFPGELYQDNVISISQSIGVPIDRFSGFEVPYVRVCTFNGANVYDYGAGLTSQFTDRNQFDEWNFISWGAIPRHRGNVHEGFVEAITYFKESKEPILHILHHVTDVVLSTAVRIQDIEEVAIYPDNAARVKAMHQNAEVDGSSWASSQIRGYKYSFREEFLRNIIENCWPEPQVVYTR